MNQHNTLLEPETETEKAEDYFDAEAWISVLDEYPRTARRVFIRMASGSVEMGSWDSHAGTWNYSPFSVGGTPVAWAGLPLAHGAPWAQGS